MSDLPLTDDELLSSALDNELSPDERALLDERLDREPDLAERMAALRAAQDLATTPVSPLPPVDLDRLVANALAASTTAANVTDLTAARAMRRWRRPAMAVAASAAVLALAIPTIGALRGDDDADFATGEAAVNADASSDDETITADGAAPEGAMLESERQDPMETAAAEEAPAADVEMLPPESDPVATPGGDSLLQQPALFDSRAFDPLMSPAGTYSSIDDLLDSVAASYRDDSGTESATPDEESTSRSQADQVIAALGFTHCDGLIDDLDRFDYGGEVVAGDFAVADVADETVLVAITQLDDGTAVMITVASGTCEIVATALP